jgi:heme exporter protein A
VKPDSPPAIETRQLFKSFGYRPALRGIDLTVARGERLVFLGPNGAGKTTLVKVLATLAKPSSGEVWLQGLNIREHPARIRRNIGMLGHQNYLYPNLTVTENLRFYGKMYRITDLDKRIEEVIDLVQLDSRRDDRVGALSHGLQRRAALARAVLHQPSILFLDEPESGLDPGAGSIIRDIVGNINQSDLTVVMISHNLERCLELGSSYAILYRGQLVYRSSGERLNLEELQRLYNHYTEATTP